jgi:hypothetical protein
LNFFSQENPDDYVLCLNHQEGDLDIIPEDLQKKFCDFARIKIWPAVLVCLGNIFPDFLNFSVADLEKDGFYLPYNIKPISGKLNYDLLRATEY